MHVPRFWEHESTELTTKTGYVMRPTCWGWSETSLAEAKQRASEAIGRVVNHFSGHDEMPDHYGYGERLPREQIIDEIRDSAGEIKAMVTRNLAGSLILNTRDLIFIDVDLPSLPLHRPTAIGFFGKLFGQTQAAPPEVTARERVSGLIDQATSSFPQLGFRIYETRNGYRIMVGNRVEAAGSALVRDLFDRFGADPLYVRLCESQKCFRARLSPKAWRCQLRPPPHRFPYSGQAQEAANQTWETAYLDACQKRATCRFVKSVGPDECIDQVADLVELHDSLTKSFSDEPLA